MKSKSRKNPHAVALGRRGGKSRSRAKILAARKNGKLGGRPSACERLVFPINENLFNPLPHLLAKNKLRKNGKHPGRPKTLDATKLLNEDNKRRVERSLKEMLKPIHWIDFPNSPPPTWNIVPLKKKLRKK